MNVATIVTYLEERVRFDGPPQNLRSAIEAVLFERHGLPAIQAAERADRVEEKVSTAIAAREVELSNSGGSPVIRIVGATSSRVAGFGFALVGESADVIALRMQRAHAQAILNKIRGLSFQDFEKFGARFLCELGARVGRVTGHSNDGGIDFYGEFSFGQLHEAPEPFFILAKDVRLLFAGQAKHYPNRSIGPSVIRELIGAMSLARTKTHPTDGVDIFKDLEIRPFSPVLAMLFTTGEFTSGASRLATAAGIVIKTGLQLAVFLSDRSVGLVADGDGLAFSDEAFSEWLNHPIPQ